MALSMRQVRSMQGMGLFGDAEDDARAAFDASMAESRGDTQANGGTESRKSNSSSSSASRSGTSRALDSFYGRSGKPAEKKTSREVVDQQNRQSEPITRTVDNSTTSISMSNLVGDRGARVSPLSQSWQFGLPAAPSRGITVRGGGLTQTLMLGLGLALTGAVAYYALKG